MDMTSQLAIVGGLMLAPFFGFLFHKAMDFAHHYASRLPDGWLKKILLHQVTEPHSQRKEPEARF